MNTNRIKTLLFALMTFVLLISVAQTASAQVFSKEVLLTSSTGQNYFQLKASAGDSTYNLKIDYTYKYNIGTDVTYQLWPDSAYIKSYATSDSLVSVRFWIKRKYSSQVNTWDVGGLADSIANSSQGTAAVVRNFTKIPINLIRPAIPGGLGFSALANAWNNATGNGATGSATAAKVYVSIVFYYTLSR
jgi:hypothetical protein